MDRHHGAAKRLRRVVVVTIALTAGVLLPAYAQSEDPPARVGALTWLQGSVSTHAADALTWSPAVRNDPLSSGQALWTQPQAMAELALDASAIWLNGGTELDIGTIDLLHFAASEPQGETLFELRNLAPGETYTVQTPRGLVSISDNGVYDIVAGDADHPTKVSVLEGRAMVSGTDLALQVPAGRTATITATAPVQGSVVALAESDFATEVIQRGQAYPTRSADVPGVVYGMTGTADLAQYGTWQSVPQYGDIWYPQVDAGWAPYTSGSWSFIAPWGWTWIDEAPWGFAPFHYGRWLRVDDRWGWLPAEPGRHAAPSERPVYAPALVSFFGAGAAALAGGRVGWVPLGPGEPYYPPYHASEAYLRRVNALDMSNANALDPRRESDRTVDRFANRAAASIVPAPVFADSRPVGGALQRLLPAAYGGEHPQPGRPPLAPTPQTRGLTPAVARDFGFSETTHPTAPGPAIRPTSLPQVIPRYEPPALRQPGAAEHATPPQIAHPGATSAVTPVRPEVARPETPRVEAPHAEPSRPAPPAAAAAPPRPEPPRPAPRHEERRG